MNHPPIAFPRPAPELKLPRSSSPASAEKWAATLAEERRRLAEDEAALRERENNLREYEARLRALQAEIDAERTNTTPAPAAASTTAVPFARPSSRTPFGDDTALQAGWEKLHRAREILEAEQTHLRDDRIAVREQEANMKRREAAVAQREAALAEREASVAARTPKPAPVHIEEESAVARLTSAPFKIARAVLGKG
ncbi:MAG TPA: hypothetical protein VGE76_06570 [Opitutaceae bacterium]